MQSSIWVDLAARLLLPILVWLTCGGVALLAERLLRLRLPDALLVPAGLGPCITLALLGHEADLPPWLWTAVVAGLAVVGLVLAARGRGGLRRLFPPWALAAAAGVYLLYLAPVIFHTGWTWGGYNFLNDTSIQFLLTSWIQDGAPPAAFPTATPDGAIRMYVDTAYPLGTHAHLATLDLLLGLRPEAAYQSYLAALAGVGATAVFRLFEAARTPRAYAAAAAVVALGANLTFQYALQGSIKEIGFAVAFLCTAALSRELIAAERPAGVAVLWALGAAAMLATYSAAGLPYLGLLGVITAALVLLRRDLPLVAGRLPVVGVGAVVLVVAALPSAGSIVDFAHLITGIYTEGSGAGGGSVAPPLGQLQAPLPAYQGLGVWLHGEYVFPVPGGLPHTLTVLAAGAIALLGLGGLVLGLRRREPALLLAAVPAAVAFAVVAPRVAPYADAKMLAIGSPALVAIALWALAPLLAGRVWVLGIGVAGLVAAPVVVSDAMATHDVRLAPTGRMQDLADVGRRYAGKGPILESEFEEFAKYFARKTKLNAATESVAERFVVLRRPESTLGYSYDLDAEVLEYVTAFPYVLVRRGPASSRPPSGYRLDYANASYQVWRRVAENKVVEHLPLGSNDDAAAVPSCREVRGLARRTPAGAALVAAPAPEVDALDLDRDNAPAPGVHISAGWGPDPLSRDELWMATPGRASGTVQVRGGRYAVWVRGSFPRPLDVLVAGRRVGQVQGVNTPGGWLSAGTVDVPAGKVALEIRRRGGRPLPGDGARARTGALALASTRPAGGLRRVAPADARQLCGWSWDWIEVVRP